MRRRFFVEKFEHGRAIMQGEPAHHLGRVLRAQVGQQYELSDGEQVWLGTIDCVRRDLVEFALEEKLPAFQPELRTTLLLAVVKFEAFEWALEKATELGVSRVVPLVAARSEKALLLAAVKRAERWKKILVEASEQSRRVRIPELTQLTKVQVAFAERDDPVRILLSEAPEARPLRQILDGRRAETATLAIGPEGGWTDTEFAAARAAGWNEASLGRLILRTETAVAAGLASLNYGIASNSRDNG